MKYLILSFLICFALISCDSKSSKSKVTPTISSDVYDSVLAKKYGADDYGMKQYVIAFLKKGPSRDQDSVEAEKLFRAHLDNIHRMSETGDLLIAGPFMDDSDVSGIYIFNVKTIQEAQKLTETDPAIKAGRLIMDLHPWYGPAGLMVLDSIQKKITKKKI